MTMSYLSNVLASRRVLARLAEGRLKQGTWRSEENGREFACVLGAISPRISSASDCPGSVMPEWLARLTVRMFDGQSKSDAMAWASRFGAQMSRWHALNGAAWERVRSQLCESCVADAQRSAVANAAAATYAAAASAAANAAAHAAAHAPADAAYSAAVAAAAAAVNSYAAAACWARLGTALCDAIDAELAALAAKETP